MDANDEKLLGLTRRHLFQQCGVGLGAIALSGLLQRDASAKASGTNPMAPKPAHGGGRARSVIFLHMAGGPSQLDLFDPKPKLRELHGQVVPTSFTEGKRFAFLKPGAKLLGSASKFATCGKSGAVISTLLPQMGSVADDLCIIRTMATDVFNHGPAKLFMQTGSPQQGRPSMGAWITYGIGSESSNLPGFVVLQSGPRGPRGGAPLWGCGFLPTTYQGVPFLPGPQPIVNLATPKGFDTRRQEEFFHAVRDLNNQRLDLIGDPEIATRMAAYETAYRMQTGAPELMDLSRESPATLEMYGAGAGSGFADNCLLARRLVERGVRFVQLYHTDWDHHGGPGADLESSLPKTCKEVDQPVAALIRDLKQRGMLDETIVVWGGEFGRTPRGEPRETTGRDHHIEAFTMWVAGGGFARGLTHGETDEIGYTVARDRVHIHDLHATLLHQLGLDHKQLIFRSQGRDFRLTDVAGEVIRPLLA